MPSSPSFFAHLHLSATAALWLLLAGCALGQGQPPADGVLDETRALTTETRRQIAEELRHFRADLKCEAWITASSFTPAGVTVRRQAQTTRRAWSGDRPAVLMGYDRATNSIGMSFSPALWQRYPSAELVEIMQETSRIFANEALSLDERLALAARSWMDRLRALESVQLRQTLLIQQDEKRFAVVVAAVLAGLAFVAALLGLLSRRRAASAEHQFHLPEVQVGMRFGAPYGGGVTVELKSGA